VSQVLRAQLQAISDEQLSGLIAKRASEEACTELFRRYHQKIYLWCYNYTHDTEEAVDLTQDIFIKLFKHIGSFSGLSKFSTWVYQVTRNHCLGELAKKRHQWRKKTLSIDGDETLQIADADVYDMLDVDGDLNRIMEFATGAMKADELEAFVLHYRDGLTVKEITKTLKCENVTGARTLIQNARRKFKRLLDEKGFRDDQQ
jgi:RNA polymerase sigma-70 factor (ECF subfamily)